MYKKGQIVKYVEPKNDDEERERFVVIDDSESRLLLGSVDTTISFGSTCVRSTDDVCLDVDVLIVESKITAQQLAIAFSKQLRDTLSASQMRQVIERNRAETLRNICHSHDFCDANMIMLAAFAQLLQVDDSHIGVGACSSDMMLRLWSAAWSMAKTSEFEVQP